ncbi:MAG TPA: O-succinylhomoserine sulfhydrylase [Gammaproteobacteria bacterium]|nr:O-succinylhomoserine sulfhydrylase [Gammaproteobacteria bacterium]
MVDKKKPSLETLAVRAGQVRTPEGEHSEAMFLTSSFVFENAEEAESRFVGGAPGNIYSRFTNPTVRTFETRLAAMEGAEACVGTASGMSAILVMCMALLQQGDHVVIASGLFGSTTQLFNNYIAKFGVNITTVPTTDTDAWRNAVNAKTRLMFLETPTNPLTEVADLPALAQIARDKGCYLVVDNCFCTPALQRPIELGAHMVIHSATKYIDGQGRCVGGAIVGDEETITKQIVAFMRNGGPTMSAFNAWVFLKGLETLPLRMQAHSRSAMELAEWLENHPAVERVYYPGLVTHPQHDLARAQQQAFGGIVSFDVKGGREQAWKVINSAEWLSITANLGDAKTTITHPATTTHGRLKPEQRVAAGISDALIRVAVGLESMDDIKADLTHGLDALL